MSEPVHLFRLRGGPPEGTRVDRQFVLRCGVVAFGMAAILLARWALPVSNLRDADAYLVVLLIVAASASAWWAGTWVGLAATALSLVGFLILSSPDNLGRIHGSLVLIVSGVGLSLLIGALQTVRRAAALRAQESQAWQSSYHVVFDRNPMPLWVYDVRTLKFLEVNEAALAEFGYTRQDLSKMTILDVSPPEQVPQIRQHLAETDDSVVHHTLWKVRKKDGSVVDVEMASNRLTFAGRAARIALGIDVTERQRHEAEMRQARHEAEAANRARGQFLAMLSHELRTPLTPVLTALGELLEQGLPANVRPTIEMVQRNVELEARLIDDLLDLIRAERRLMRLSMETVDVHELIRRVVQICGIDVENAGLRLELELGAQRHDVAADPARVQQVLWNLLKNAATYTPSGGMIRVSTRNSFSDLGTWDGGQRKLPPSAPWPKLGEASSGSDSWLPRTPVPSLGRVIIEVSDTGLGLEADDLGRIFDPFERGHAAETRSRGRAGLGLGLAISRSIAEAHGGRLTARSEGPGKGSTFTLELAVATQKPQTAEPPSVPSTGPIDVPLCILLVDDNADTLSSLESALRRRNHTVTTADTVASALQAVEAAKFDLIISDIELPDGSGHDLMRAVRTAGHSHVLGIALSGFGSTEDIKASRSAGFLLHITKPITLARLEDAIRQALAHRVNRAASS
jgi:PAS domain S-box-containing protein